MAWLCGTVEAMENFHVPLPDDIYARLRAAAGRSKAPATALAREAIDFWLKEQRRKAQYDAIAGYAAGAAGTALDLDLGSGVGGNRASTEDREEIQMKRGEVHWADLVPRSGSEQTGRRPVLVISHDGFNQTPGWRSVIVVPISTSAAQARRGPTVVAIPSGAGGLPKLSLAVCHRVTTLDRAKLTKRIGVLPADIMEEVELGLRAAMDLE